MQEYILFARVWGHLPSNLQTDPALCVYRFYDPLYGGELGRQYLPKTIIYFHVFLPQKIKTGSS